MAIKKFKLRLVGRIWKICCYYVCTKNVHFTFKNIYQQKDGIAMWSPLGAVLTGKFMLHLEKTLMPKLEKLI